MKVDDALGGVTRLFLDTAPVIYYVEGNPKYLLPTNAVFERIDNGALLAVTSPVTLAECLIAPYRANLPQVSQAFLDLIIHGNNTAFAPIGREAAQRAAKLRTQYNLTLTNAMQVAVALTAGCQAFLTNDAALRRIRDLRVLMLDELEV